MAFKFAVTPVSIGSNPQTLTFGSPVAVGDLIVVDLTQYYAANPLRAVLSVSDNVNSGNYALAIDESARGDVASAIYWKVANAAGTPTVSISFDIGPPAGAVAARVYDAEHTVLGPTNAGNGSSTSLSTGSVSPSGTALYVALWGPNYPYVTLTPPAGWTTRNFYQAIDGSLPLDHYSADLIGSGAQNPTVTFSAATVASAAIVTFLLGDTTAPTLTLPTGAATSSTAATIGATTDEANGTMYAVVDTVTTTPSAAELDAGQDGDGGAAAWSGSQAITTTGAKTFNVTGLAPNTAYTYFIGHKDAAGNFSNIVSGTFTTYQRSGPASDVSAGAWTSSLGGALAAAIDETSPDEADYIETSAAGDVCTVGLGSLVDPAVSTGHQLSYRIGGDGVSGIQVDLMQGGTVIATWTHDPAPALRTTFVQTLTGTQAESITDYTALRLRFTEI